MRYRTINLRPRTHERLRIYKLGGKTFDTVLNELMDCAPPERLHSSVLREYRRRLRRKP